MALLQLNLQQAPSHLNDNYQRAERDQDTLIFKQFHQMEDGIESFEYLFELKELYAQEL